MDLLDMSRLMCLIERLGNVVISSGLLLMTNLPLAFSLAFIPIQRNNVLILIGLSVTLGPSLTALNYAYFHGDALVRHFFKGYRDNWRQAWAVSSGLTGLLLLFTYDSLFVLAHPQFQFFLIPLVFVLAFLVLLGFYTALLLARYTGSIRIQVRNAAILTGRHGFRNIGLLFFASSVFLVTKATNMPLLQLLLAGVIAIGSFYWLRGTLERVISKP